MEGGGNARDLHCRSLIPSQRRTYTPDMLRTSALATSNREGYSLDRQVDKEEAQIGYIGRFLARNSDFTENSVRTHGV